MQDSPSLSPAQPKPNVCFCDAQAAALRGLPGRQPAVPGGEPGLRPAGEDVLRRGQNRRAGEGGHQRHPVRPGRHLALVMPLQDRKDVAG